MKGLRYVPLLLAGIPLFASAQQIRSGYVDWGVTGPEFPKTFEKWNKGVRITEDDNFFISRVKPRERFRNQNTQVNPALDESVDKKLIFWVPINNSEFNALPDGVYDSEVFPMWSYITHYGNWTTSLIRMPGGFADVAHKNGVPVSVVASVPYGAISDSWLSGLTALSEVSPQQLADFLLYYGVDGIGYNSEFSGPATLVDKLGKLHEETLKLMKSDGKNPIAEFIWYDGTNNNGQISFDRGLGSHNAPIWGSDDNIRTSLFFNYNWNSGTLLSRSVRNAKSLGRSPLDLYCGINMQGREPRPNTQIWTLLADYPLSIGLWGAHQKNMFYESRAERGSSPDVCQRTYLQRVERWFTGGSRNPVNTPDLSNSLVYSAEHTDFCGMSKMMSARSALKWDLSSEPFITYFNLGNGKYFNYKGERQHNSEWYNISMQDYLPTWMWWFSSKFMGRDASDVPANGLDAEFVWDDAFMGGSSLRIFGSCNKEFLHLFKTEFSLKQGDEITIRYKQINGNANAYLALSQKGTESDAIGANTLKFISGSDKTYGHWVEKRFVVGEDIKLNSEAELAMVALCFENASDVDIRLGEFSIKRLSDLKASVATPVIEKTELLSARHDGYDGKIIFNMPNDKGNDVCYNIDVNTSLFKLYSQQLGEKPVLMGMTTSWAGLVFSAPFSYSGEGQVRFGVSALALDHQTESEIAWGDYQNVDSKFETSNDIVISKKILTPGEPFSISYLDPSHNEANWTLVDSNGNSILESHNSRSLQADKGIERAGVYTLILKEFENGAEGNKESVRELKGFLQVFAEDKGEIPEILTVDSKNATSSSEKEGMHLFGYEDHSAELSFSANMGEAAMSRGVKVGRDAFGFKFKDSGLEEEKSFSVSFWMKPESFRNRAVHMLNIRHKGDPWAVNNWGWFWHTLNEDGTSAEFTIRMASGNSASYRFDGLCFTPGAWYNVAYVFEFNDKGYVCPALYVNGEKIKVSSWSLGSEQQSGEPTFVGPVGDWKTENVLALGGYLHTTGSVNCNLDNFMVWNKALDSSDLQKAMGDIDSSGLPAGLVGFFDFEESPDSDGKFENKGSGEFKAGMHDYIDTEVEGQGTIRWKQPEYISGSPFIKGNGFHLSPEVRWIVPGGRVVENVVNKEGGSAKIEYLDYKLANSYPDGYPVTLSVGNEYGEDSRSLLLKFKYTGVEAVGDDSESEAIEVSPTLFEGEINVVAPEQGNLIVSLYSLDGRRLLANGFSCEKGEKLCIYPEVASGMYLLLIEKEGKVLGSAKVTRK